MTWWIMIKESFEKTKKVINLIKKLISLLLGYIGQSISSAVQGQIYLKAYVVEYGY